MDTSRIRYGEQHPRSRVPDSTVQYAREQHQAGRRVAEIARELEQPYHTVYDWCAYRTRQGVRALREAA